MLALCWHHCCVLQGAIRKRKGEWVSGLPVTQYCIGIASECKDKRAGVALVTSHELSRLHQLQVLIVELTLALLPDVRIREWEWLVEGSM